jgi:hypothetical protein
MARCLDCSHLDRDGESNRCRCFATGRMHWAGDLADECALFRRKERANEGRV